MSAGVLLLAAALLVWPTGAAVQRLRGLSPGNLTAPGRAGPGGTGRAALAEARRIVERLPVSMILPPAAGAGVLVACGPLHAGAALVLTATVVDLRGRALRRRRALTGLGAWERALDDASSALRAGAGPGLALRRAASAAEMVEAAAAAGSPSGSGAAASGHTHGARPGHPLGAGPHHRHGDGPVHPTHDVAGRRGVAAILMVAAAHADLGGDVAGALGSARTGGVVDTAGVGPAGGRTPEPAPSGVDSGVGAIAGELAGAWLLAVRHGVVLADAVDGLRADVASRRARAVRVDSTLAGPRATAVILTGLPAFGVLLGSGFGADPLTVLLRGTLGGVLCLAGAVFLAAGLLWTDRIAGGALR